MESPASWNLLTSTLVIADLRAYEAWPYLVSQGLVRDSLSHRGDFVAMVRDCDFFCDELGPSREAFLAGRLENMGMTKPAALIPDPWGDIAIRQMEALGSGAAGPRAAERLASLKSFRQMSPLFERDLDVSIPGAEIDPDATQLFLATEGHELAEIDVPGYRTARQVAACSRWLGYEAIETGAERRQVLIQVLRRPIPENVSWFQRICRVSGQLDHPRIPKLVCASTCAGFPYLMFDWYPEEDLVSRVHRCGPVPAPDVVPIVAQIADALDHAHALGIVHGNLHPASIQCGADSQCWVTGFGEFPFPDGTLGNVHHLAPEQLAAAKALRQSDIYMLAELAYFLLTGQFAFRGSVQEWGPLKREEWSHSASASRPNLPPTVDLVLQRALTICPQNRFATASQFARALRVALLTAGPDLPGSPADGALTHEEHIDRIMRVLIDPSTSEETFGEMINDLSAFRWDLTSEDAAPLLAVLPSVLQRVEMRSEIAVDILSILGEPCLEELRREAMRETLSNFEILDALVRCDCWRDAIEIMHRHVSEYNRRDAAAALRATPKFDETLPALRVAFDDAHAWVRKAASETYLYLLNELAKRFGVGASPLREELKTLLLAAARDEAIREGLTSKWTVTSWCPILKRAVQQISQDPGSVELRAMAALWLPCFDSSR